MLQSPPKLESVNRFVFLHESDDSDTCLDSKKLDCKIYDYFSQLCVAATRAKSKTDFSDSESDSTRNTSITPKNRKGQHISIQETMSLNDFTTALNACPSISKVK